MEYIDYNISPEYLSHWTKEDALREIIQNFLDYGEHDVVRENYIILSNEYEPENLNFLSVGVSRKHSNKAIGKYGEGLKMALMILAREDIPCFILAAGYKITPLFREGPTGKGFSVSLEEFYTTGFNFCMQYNEDEFNDFYDNKIVKKDEVIFTHEPYGSIVNKKSGDIFCGGLFVANIKKIKKSYNFNPEQLNLDRDRKTASSVDVNWAASYINAQQGKTEAAELEYDENEYVPMIRPELVKQFEPKLIGDDIKFTYKNKEGEEKVLNNRNATSKLKNDNWFSEQIKKIRAAIASSLGIYELLLDFKEKYVSGKEQEDAFDLILERFKNER